MQKSHKRGQIGKAEALTSARIFQAEAPNGRFAGGSTELVEARFLPDAQQVGVVP